jgi:hypothetical protein
MYHGAMVAMRRHLELQYLQLHNMGASGGPPDGICIVHRGTDVLLIQQHTIPDGETASSVYERTQCSHPLCLFLSHLIDMCRPGEPFIKCHPKITGGIDVLDWLPEEVNWSGLDEERRGALRDIDGYPPITQPPF